MKDSSGTILGHRDIVARRTNAGWRISRVALVGYTDPTKVQPLAMCIDFESHGLGTSWQEVTDSSRLQRITAGASWGENAEELVKRIPELSRVLDDFELHMLSAQLSKA